MSVPRSMALPPDVAPIRLATPGSAGGPDLAALHAPATGPQRRLPALLVPGFTGSKEDFLHLLPLLAAAGHEAYALDLRGQFESPGPDDDAAYAVPALAAEVAAVARTLAPDGALHLLGHSFGGLVCRAALLDGTRARSFTLLGSGPAAIPSPRADVLRLMRPVLEQGGVTALYEASEALAEHDPRREPPPPEVAEFLRRRFLAMNPVSVAVMGQALLDEPDRTGELAALGLPVLVAHGEGDDAWHPPVQQEMAARLGAPVVAIPAALHSPAAENPEHTAQVLLDSWRDVEQR